jgi:hypothetical protein
MRLTDDVAPYFEMAVYQNQSSKMEQNKADYYPHGMSDFLKRTPHFDILRDQLEKELVNVKTAMSLHFAMRVGYHVRVNKLLEQIRQLFDEELERYEKETNQYLKSSPAEKEELLKCFTML